MKTILITLLTSALVVSSGSAHESVGRAGFKEPPGVEVETEFYVGHGGYLHGGLGAITSLNEKQTVGIVGHFVREDADGEIFPSLGAEFIQDLGNDFELEAFTFGYFPVERQSAWAVGLRGSRRFDFCDDGAIRPFFGPAYSHVRALDEETESPVSIGHLMLLGGVDIEVGPIDFTLFGSHSFFSRNPVGLETHVDLEEMTHFAAYENNDGFARNTVGAELAYSLTDRFTLKGGYALILYEDETRHSLSLTPAVKVGENLEVFAGIQLLRGDGPDNELGVTGVAFSF